MTARASVLSAAFLRAGLLAAVMAIVAGIFGMHVMTADHSSHSAHTEVSRTAGDAAVGHAPVAHTPDAREAGASCTPLAKAGSLAAVPPPAGHTALLAPAASARGATGYSFIPPSPTPCELSISRT